MTENSSKTADLFRVCPVCDRDDAEIWLQKGTLRLMRCHACTMVFANPVSPELATGEYYDRLGVPFYLSPDKLESDYASARFERELRLFRAYCSVGRVLDVGCSTGAFLFQLRNRYAGTYIVTGTDVATAALDYCVSRGLEIIRQSFLEFDSGPRRFDAITFWAVMEHLAFPRRYLQKAAALLEPGGFCFILVPNLQSLAVRLLREKYRYIMPEHVNYFSAATLRAFVRDENLFDVVATGSCHFNPLVILHDIMGNQEQVSDEDRIRLLRRTTRYKQNTLLRPIKALYSSIEQVLGRMYLADNLFMVLRRNLS